MKTVSKSISSPVPTIWQMVRNACCSFFFSLHYVRFSYLLVTFWKLRSVVLTTWPHLGHYALLSLSFCHILDTTLCLWFPFCPIQENTLCFWLPFCHILDITLCFLPSCHILDTTRCLWLHFCHILDTVLDSVFDYIFVTFWKLRSVFLPSCPILNTILCLWLPFCHTLDTYALSWPSPPFPSPSSPPPPFSSCRWKTQRFQKQIGFVW